MFTFSVGHLKKKINVHPVHEKHPLQTLIPFYIQRPNLAWRPTEGKKGL